MPERTIIGYAIVALIVAMAIVAVLLARYYGKDERARRQRRREDAEWAEKASELDIKRPSRMDH